VAEGQSPELIVNGESSDVWPPWPWPPWNGDEDGDEDEDDRDPPKKTHKFAEQILEFETEIAKASLDL
jgi:endothelin-converting enzyme